MLTQKTYLSEITMKKLILLLAILNSACEKLQEGVEEIKAREKKTYEIVCKHPFGHIKKYKVNRHNFDMPSNFRGGLWIFTDVNGLKVRSTFCHGESF